MVARLIVKYLRHDGDPLTVAVDGTSRFQSAV
jgi:hypothetical protein